MKAYLSLIVINLKLAFREKAVLFFTFVFPLIFFFVLSQMMGGMGARIVSMVLLISVLGNGFFGAGIRAVVERETNILRRYKVTPISAAPILVASIITGWLLYLPVIGMVFILASVILGVPFPDRWIELLILLSVGACSMRAIGLIVASVVNSAQESNILINLLYMPMLFLSGATFPVSALPDWAQVLSQFLPATYLHNGMERVMIRGEGLADNLTSVVALAACGLVATFISMKIFRWEKEEVIPRSAKLWLLVAGLPFILLGAYQFHSRENVDEARALDRELRRNQTRLIRGARIFVGDGTVIESGGVLIRNGRIATVYRGDVPDPATLGAEVVEGAGKTVLPGLIDTCVHLTAPAGASGDLVAMDSRTSVTRALAAYLYSGVTAVRHADGEELAVLEAAARVAGGTDLGAEVFQRLTRPVRYGLGEGRPLTEGAATSASLTFHPAENDLAFDPMMATAEALYSLSQGDTHLLSRSLVEQVAPPGTIEAIRAASLARPFALDLEEAKLNLQEAYAADVPLAAGTGSGNPLLLHGPAIHRELQLWVETGVRPAEALEAATHDAAQLVGASDRIGLIEEGYEASLVLVDGNPLDDISTTERISVLFFKGELISRDTLFAEQ